MAENNYTEGAPKQNNDIENREKISGFDSVGIYRLSPDATRADVRDLLSNRLSQLEALLTATCGQGAESFQNWNSTIQDNYLWTCAGIAKECSVLAEIA
jgi:hypothetical protein